LGVDDKDRNSKEGKKDTQHSSGLGCPQNQKDTSRNSSHMEKHFATSIERALSSSLKVGVISLTIFAFGMLFFVCAAHTPVVDRQHLTRNFIVEEFTYKCEDALPVRFQSNLSELSRNLQVIRNHIQKPIIVISGYRSFRCNTRVKGAKNSQHMDAKAADIVVKGMAHRDLQRVILKLIREKKISEGGVGFYRTHVHYDIRGSRSRWHKIIDKFIHVIEHFSDEGG
jgi:hypothetical protein